MKLAAIYNVWDGAELLGGSIKCIEKYVDLIIITYQQVSNFGEYYNPMTEINAAVKDIPHKKIFIHKYHPFVGTGFRNETVKRNKGLDIARFHQCSHFFHIDCDEYYKDFGRLKEFYIHSKTNGSVLNIMTYFKKPTLRLENPDNYFVPFIHRLDKITEVGMRPYPFYSDPTRRVNTQDVIIIPGFMHHFSYIRKDINRKVNNSSARDNIQKSKLLECYNDPQVGAGYYLPDYKQKLIEVENIFNIKI